MKNLILLLFFLTTITSYGQNIKLSINSDNANQTFEYLKAKKTDIDGARALLQLPGTKGMIAHDSEFNNQLTAENFINELTDPSFAGDAFRFKSIRKDLPSIERTIAIFRDSLTMITNRIEEDLNPYILEVDTTPIDVYFVLGGNSDGYSTDKNTFYLEVQFYGDDIEGIVTLVTHEIYHIIQQRSFTMDTDQLSMGKRLAYMLIANLYQEGSASYMADLLRIEDPKSYSQFLQKKYRRNMGKLGESFYLFESLLASTKSKSTPDGNILYGLGFGGQWDSPFYFVGYEICKRLEEAYGKFYIKNYLSKPVTYFLTDYIELYRSNPEIEFKFSAESEEDIYDLHKTLQTY